MEQETIFYYYPTSEQRAAKRHWFQEAALKAEAAAGQKEFCIMGCAVPPFYYRRKPWKAQILSRTMETVLGAAAGMADTYVHPEIGKLLTDEYCPKWTPREGTIRMLARHLLEQYAKEVIERCGTVTVLLGQPGDTDRQMEMTWELLQPYLPKVNRLLIFYEKQEMPQENGREQDENTNGLFRGRRHRKKDDPVKAAGKEEPAELEEYLDDYYYEYGLVPQLEPYIYTRAVRPETQQTTPAQEDLPLLRCGKPKCSGVILDYCDRFRYPKVSPSGCVYIDTASVDEKERILRRKSLPVPYVSPLKYLDTMVKNSYDRKVKMR